MTNPMTAAELISHYQAHPEDLQELTPIERVVLTRLQANQSVTQSTAKAAGLSTGGQAAQTSYSPPASGKDLGVSPLSRGKGEKHSKKIYDMRMRPCKKTINQSA